MLDFKSDSETVNGYFVFKEIKEILSFYFFFLRSFFLNVMVKNIYTYSYLKRYWVIVLEILQNYLCDIKSNTIFITKLQYLSVSLTLLVDRTKSHTYISGHITNKIEKGNSKHRYFKSFFDILNTTAPS